MFVSDIAEIMEIKGRILSVQPLGSLKGKKLPVIHGVPLGLLGRNDNYTDHNLKIGDIIVILYTTVDVSMYVAYQNKDDTSTVEENTYNSAIALPISFSKENFEIALPAGIKKIGNEEHEGDLKQFGKQETTGIIFSKEDIIAQKISLTKHGHDVSLPEHVVGTERSSPSKE